MSRVVPGVDIGLGTAGSNRAMRVSRFKWSTTVRNPSVEWLDCDPLRCPEAVIAVVYGRFM
jgi:hypothetical protein